MTNRAGWQLSWRGLRSARGLQCQPPAARCSHCSGRAAFSAHPDLLGLASCTCTAGLAPQEQCGAAVRLSTALLNHRGGSVKKSSHRIQCLLAWAPVLCPVCLKLVAMEIGHASLQAPCACLPLFLRVKPCWETLLEKVAKLRSGELQQTSWQHRQGMGIISGRRCAQAPPFPPQQAPPPPRRRLPLLPAPPRPAPIHPPIHSASPHPSTLRPRSIPTAGLPAPSRHPMLPCCRPGRPGRCAAEAAPAAAAPVPPAQAAAAARASCPLCRWMGHAGR